MKELTNAIGSLLIALKTREDARMAKNFPTLTPGTFDVQYGRTYARIVKIEAGESGGSAFCFVALKDVRNKKISAQAGDILKPDGWKGPARGKRGSVFGENILAGTTEYGCVYFVR